MVVFRQNIADNRNTKNISDLVSLDPRTGDTRVLVTIPAAGRQIDLPGAAPDTAVSWRVPVVVTLTSSDSGSGNSTRIDCVDLKSRRTWMRSIPVKMYLTQPTAPAAGNEVVALAYTFVAGGTRRLGRPRQRHHRK